MSGRSVLPATATKREKFVFYANTRAKAAVKAIDNLAKLTDVKTYEYTKADIEKLAKAVGDATDRMKLAFDKPGSGAAVDAIIG